MKMKKLIACIAPLSVGTLFSSPLLADQSWDMAIAYPASNYHSEVAQQFADQVSENTNGDITITLHANGSLYSGEQIYPSTRRGLVQVGERLIAALENEDPLFGLDSLPFLATNFDDSRELYEASKPALERRLEEDGLKLLYSFAWPPQGIYTNKQVDSIDDFQGVKFRAYSPTTEKIAELMGAAPTSVEAADVPQAFATGVAEAMFSSGSTGYDSRLWEHIDYWYDTQAWLPRGMVFINSDYWEDLTPEQQEGIESAAQAAEDAGWERAEELAGWYKEQLEAEGMGIVEPDENLMNEFNALGQQLIEEWVEKIGTEGEDILTTYLTQESE